jgi:hypothetical protein
VVQLTIALWLNSMNSKLDAHGTYHRYESRHRADRTLNPSIQIYFEYWRDRGNPDQYAGEMVMGRNTSDWLEDKICLIVI